MEISEKYQRALVTGGAGFIGSNLIEELLAEGLDVVSIDNYSGGKKENLFSLHEQYGNKLVELDIETSHT